ncbi:MAG: hypothetical protein APF81_14555 [Desulfosporosinus sp. BRH_c37]|nr:MAG: hypothetical protein APF81_14555 [Desulfosporosinus sp. BRH_c37]
MSSTFWTNTIWFFLLFVTSIITNVIIFHKTNNKKFCIAFLFSIIGLSFVFEAILVLGLNAYSYYPKLFRDSYLDIIFGNYFSQISISSTSLLLATFDLSYVWYGIFAIIYFIIDIIFVKLGIYEHFWYKSIYTIFGFILFSFLARKWYIIAKKSTNYFINYLSLYFCVASFSTFSIFLGQRLLGIQLLRSNIFFTDINRNNTSSGFIYQFIVLNYLIILYKSRLNWIVKTLALSCLYIAQYFAYRAGYIFIHKGLFFTVTSLDLLGCYCLIAVFNYLLSE